MLRNVLNKIFSSKIFFILFSLLVSVALWMYVEISENQTVQHQVSGVPVVLVNKDILSDRNLLISSMSPDNMTFTFECSRSVAAKLTKESLSVSIDLANIIRSGNTTLLYEINYPPGVDVNDIEVVSRNVGRISLYIDRQSSKTIRVDVPYSGGAAEGYICDLPDFSPQDITVYGPSELMSGVDRAVVQIQRENLSTTYTADPEFVLLDGNGEEVDGETLDMLTFSDVTIHVTIPVRMLKEVTLTPDFAYGSGATQQNTRYEVVPPVIVVAGDPEDLRDFNTITLNTIDLIRLDKNMDTYTRQISVPNHLTNISGETEASVMVEVIGLDIKYLTVLNPYIHVTNEPSDCTVEIWTPSVDVRIRGRQEDLDKVTEENITVVADLTDLSPGTQRVPARVNVLGVDADVGPIGSYNITVNILRE